MAAILRSLIEGCLRSIPPKATAYTSTLKGLLTKLAEQNATTREIAGTFWLVLMRPDTLPELDQAGWKIPLDESTLSILHKLLGPELISPDYHVPLPSHPDDDQEPERTVHVLASTIEAVCSQFDARAANGRLELEVMKLLLVASASPVCSSHEMALQRILDTISQIFVYSKTPVNHDAARAALTQIINEKMGRPGVAIGNPDQTTQGLVINWMTSMFGDPSCPRNLVILILDLLIGNMRIHLNLFLEGQPLHRTISKDLVPGLINAVDIHDEILCSKVLEISKILLNNWIDKEAIEVLLTHILPFPFIGEKGGRSLQASHLKPHLKSFRNKMQILDFVSENIFLDGQRILDVFLNFDADPEMSPLLGTILRMMVLYLENDWHRSDGTRASGTPFTTLDLKLKITCIRMLTKFMTLLKSWVVAHLEDESPENQESDQSDNRTNEQLGNQMDNHLDSHPNSHLDSHSNNHQNLQPRSQDKDQVLTKLANSLLQSTDIEAALRWKNAQSQCVETFNDDPLLGLEMAIKAGFASAKEIASQARWLHFTRGLDKKNIGGLLSSAGQADLLQAFASSFDFSDLSFVGAFRMFLQSFQIPGESQVIERFLEQFSRRFCECSPHLFSNQDVCFKLAYSTLILNTDKHSLHVRDKMTKAAFVKNTRGLIDQQDVSTEMLGTIYDEICANEIRMHASLVEHPLPLGSRKIAPLSSACTLNHSQSLLRDYGDLWCRAVVLAIDRLHAWPSAGSAISIMEPYEKYGDLLADVLDCFGDLIGLTCWLHLDLERRTLLERLLATIPFRPDYPAPSASPPLQYSDSTDAINWLYDIFDEHGAKMGSAWRPILTCLADWNIASVADAHHSQREFDLARLDGAGLVDFIEALLSIPRKTATQQSFMSHYAERLYQLPASNLEKIIRHSYQEPTVHSRSSTLFALLTRCSDDNLLRPFAFGIIQQVVREQIPLILEMGDKAVFDYLPSLEVFGLQNDPAMSMDAINAFVQIGDILYAQHFADGTTVSPASEEGFFLKWYRILSGLSRITAEHELHESAWAAMTALFRIMKEQGKCYQSAHWRIIWRSIIFPLMEEIRMTPERTDMSLKLVEWAIDLITSYAEQLISTELPEIFENLVRIIEAMALRFENRTVSDQALVFFQELIAKNHITSFQSQHWRLVTASLEYIFRLATPDLNTFSPPLSDASPAMVLSTELKEMNISSDTVSFPDRMARTGVEMALFSRTLSQPHVARDPISTPMTLLDTLFRQCSVQLFILFFFRSLTLEPSPEQSIVGPQSTMAYEELDSWLGLLVRSYQFAYLFNANLHLRQQMVAAGYAESVELLVLNRQESGALHMLVEILNRLLLSSLSSQPTMPCLMSKDATGPLQGLAERYFEMSSLILQRYIEMRLPGPSRRRLSKSWTEAALSILKQWTAILEHLPENPPTDGDLQDWSSRATLGLLAERATEKQIHLVVELFTCADRNSNLVSAAKDFIHAVTGRLVRLRLATMIGS